MSEHEQQWSELREPSKPANVLREALRELGDREWSELVRKSFIQLVNAREFGQLDQIAMEVQAGALTSELGELTAEAIWEFADAPESDEPRACCGANTGSV